MSLYPFEVPDSPLINKPRKRTDGRWGGRDPQTRFPLDDSAATQCLSAPGQIDCLSRAIAMSRKLLLRPDSLALLNRTLQFQAGSVGGNSGAAEEPPLDQELDATPISPALSDAINNWAHSNNTMIIVCPGLVPWAKVSPGQLGIIKVGTDLISLASNALERQQPVVALKAIVMLAITLAHEYMHHIRQLLAVHGPDFGLVGLVIDLTTLRKVRSASSVASIKGKRYGEAGFLWEQRVIGGRATVEYKGDANDSVVDELVLVRFKASHELYSVWEIAGETLETIATDPATPLLPVDWDAIAPQVQQSEELSYRLRESGMEHEAARPGVRLWVCGTHDDEP